MDLSVNPPQILMMFCVFIACAVTLHFLVFKPTLAILKERDRRLAGLAGEAKALEGSSKAKLEVYTKLMAEARAVAHQCRDEILRAAADERGRLLASAKGSAERALTAAARTLAAEAGEARLKLRGSARDLASAMAERILARRAA